MALATLLAKALGGWQPTGPEAMASYEGNEQLPRTTETKELLKWHDQ